MVKLNKKRGLFLGVCASLIILAGCGNNEDTADKASSSVVSSEVASSVAESTEVVTTASISSTGNGWKEGKSRAHRSSSADLCSSCRNSAWMRTRKHCGTGI